MSRFSDEPGAPAPHDLIPLSVPCLRGNEWNYVKECLDTNWVSSVGPFVDRFEAMVADRVGRRFAVATVNGTAALHVALLVAGIKPDEEVLVSDLTFVAPANAVRYAGAWPVFVDAEPEYLQLDPEKLKEFLERDCLATRDGLRNRQTGRIVRAILPVHILGHPCHMAPILELADRFGLVVIEDATESLGALCEGKATGHCGNIACFSFNGNKIITTGGGGMVVTDREDWATKLRYLTTQAKDDPVEFVHRAVGFNYRLTSIQAAVGCAQMEFLDRIVAEKRAIAGAYSAAFRAVTGITAPREAPWAFSTFWLYTVLVDERLCRIDSRALMHALAAGGIQSRPLWQPLHRSPAHQGMWATDCSVAERLNRQALSLPSSASLSSEQRDRVIRAVLEAAQRGEGSERANGKTSGRAEA